MKKCSKCGEILPESMFHKRSRSKDGLSYQCKDCVKRRQQKYYQRNRLKRLAHRKIYYQENQEHILEQKRTKERRQKNNESGKRWYYNNIEKVRAQSKLNWAVEKGEIKRPIICEDCGLEPDEPLHGHHQDYSRSLEVIWLCHACHMRVHGLERREVVINHSQIEV